MIHTQVVVHLLPVEIQMEVNIVQDDIQEVIFLFLFPSVLFSLIATSFVRLTASSSNGSGSSAINSSSNSSQTSSNESLCKQCSSPIYQPRCNRIISKQ